MTSAISVAPNQTYGISTYAVIRPTPLIIIIWSVADNQIWELSDRRMSERELVKQECIYDEPCLTKTAISVAPNQAYGHINIRSNQTN